MSSEKDACEPISFGSQLLALRTRAGLSGRELALKSGISQSKVSKLESGFSRPAPGDVERLAKAMSLSADVTYRLGQTARWSTAPTNPVHGDPFSSFRDRELAASRIDIFTHRVIPAVVQSPEYARHLLERHASERLTTTAVMARAERQAQLQNPHKSFRLLLSSQVLRGYIISRPRLWRQQLHFLDALLTAPALSVRVIDSDASADHYLIEDLIIHDGVRVMHDGPDFCVRELTGPIAVAANEHFESGWKAGVELTGAAILELLDEIENVSIENVSIKNIDIRATALLPVAAGTLDER